jgi:hypothetical protein
LAGDSLGPLRLTVYWKIFAWTDHTLHAVKTERRIFFISCFLIQVFGLFQLAFLANTHAQISRRNSAKRLR